MVGPICYALTFETITQNKSVSSVISGNWPSRGSILFPIVMLVIGVRCLRLSSNRAVILATMMFTLFSKIMADFTHYGFQ